MSIMEGINKCHTSLLVDRMTYGGSISSITRYTMKKEEIGPFGKASFEETMDNFINAASRGEIEPTKGVSISFNYLWKKSQSRNWYVWFANRFK